MRVTIRFDTRLTICCSCSPRIQQPRSRKERDSQSRNMTLRQRQITLIPKASAPATATRLHEPSSAIDHGCRPRDCVSIRNADSCVRSQMANCKLGAQSNPISARNSLRPSRRPRSLIRRSSIRQRNHRSLPAAGSFVISRATSQPRVAASRGPSRPSSRETRASVC